MLIKSMHGTVAFAGNTYKGLMWVYKDGERVMLINCLEIEDYVFCVLRTESWPGWPLEINKVMAVASRTYVVSMVLNAKKSQRPYHVKNTNEHQTYAGVHGCPIIKKAVDHTKGVFLAHENKPIVAMFDSCCGGIVPAYIEGVNFDDAPYLAREYACTYCKRCRVYSWEAQYTYHEIEQLLCERVKQFKQLRHIKITKKDKAGVVQEAIIKGKKSTLKFTGKKLYSLLKKVRSFSFSVHKQSDKLIFKGRGLGHHLGLCQWGAREMVRDGWDYKRILLFYYPNTAFMRLS
jgi:stage II sporulation protein D (peptidoglycan lytic transglycosylase)